MRPRTHQQNTGERLNFPHWVNVLKRTKLHFSERGGQVRGEAREISRRHLHGIGRVPAHKRLSWRLGPGQHSAELYTDSSLES